MLAKVCYFVKSRAEDIRDAARQTLARMLASLGIEYLYTIAEHLKSSLIKGTLYFLFEFFCSQVCSIFTLKAKQHTLYNVCKDHSLFHLCLFFCGAPNKKNSSSMFMNANKSVEV